MSLLSLLIVFGFGNSVYEYVVCGIRGGHFGFGVVGALDDWDPDDGIYDKDLYDEVW